MTFRLGPVGRVVHAMILVAFFTRSAIAAPGHVERARKAYEELRFEDVLSEVAAARREGKLSRPDNAELTRLEAFTYAVFDDEARALDAFRRLLAIEPRFELPPDTSPKIRGYFASARERRSPASDAMKVKKVRVEDPPFYTSGWFWGTLLVTLGVGLGIGLALEK
jgi:hypothetical protein